MFTIFGSPDEGWRVPLHLALPLRLFNDNTQACPGAVKADCGFNTESDVLWSTGLARFPAIHHVALSCRSEVSLRRHAQATRGSSFTGRLSYDLWIWPGLQGKHEGKPFSESSHGDANTFRKHNVKHAVNVSMNISMIDGNISSSRLIRTPA